MKNIVDLFSEYNRIVSHEINFRRDRKKTPNLSAEEIYRLTLQLAEIAKSSLLPRSYIENYGLNAGSTAFESVGAHTNLVMALADRALSFYYGSDFGNGGEYNITKDGYSYREIMETIRIHDLPENKIGDWPDNGSTDKKEKSALEQEYLEDFSEKYPIWDSCLKRHTLRLFGLMESPYSPTGRLIYLADKTAALLMALCYDSVGQPPMIHGNSPDLSERDCREIAMCDFRENNFFKASEMWAIDFLHIRQFNRLDDSCFFTAILVMYTLLVNGKWYSWREDDYINIDLVS